MSAEKKPSAAAAKKVRMTSFMTGNDFSYSPGDVAEFDAVEADRLVSVGGAVAHIEDNTEAKAQA